MFAPLDHTGGPQKRNREDYEYQQSDNFPIKENNNDNTNNSTNSGNYGGRDGRIVQPHQKRAAQRRDRHEDDDNEDGADDELRMQKMDPVEKEVSQAVTSALALDLKNFKNSENEAKFDSSSIEKASIVPSLVGPQVNRSICGVCESEKAKYTCPACNIRTCSLACVKVHKSETGCTGERNPAEKIGLATFNDSDLARDLRFIEEGKRIHSNCKRTYQKDFHEIHGDGAFRFSFRTLPPPLHNLREGAKRHGIICQILSEGLSKRAKNTSRYDKRTDTVTWRAEFRFHRSSHAIDDGMTSSYTTDVAFSASTDWASERFKLIDIIRNCAEANPKLDSHHIRKGYTKLHEWLQGPRATLQMRHLPKSSSEQGSETQPEATSTGVFASLLNNTTQADTHAELEEDGDFKDEDEVDESPTGRVEPQEITVSPKKSENTTSEVPEGMARIDVLEVKTSEVNASSSSGLAQSILDFLGCPSLEMNNENKSGNFSVFIRAERMGTEVCYFKFTSQQCSDLTLHDVMRDVFFVVEYPIFDVVSNDDATALAQFPVITDEQRVRFRDTFKSNKQQAGEGVDGQERAGATTFGELMGGTAGGRGGMRGNRGGRGSGGFTFSRGRGGSFNNERVNMEPGSQNLPCRNFANGSCVHGDLCPYQHIASADLPPCRSMVQTGKCDRGDRCSFSHDPEIVSARAREVAFRGRGRGGGRGGRGSDGGRGGYSQVATPHQHPPRSEGAGAGDFNQAGYPLPSNPYQSYQ